MSRKPPIVDPLRPGLDPEHAARDRFTARILGGFILLLSVLVLFGLPQAELAVDRLLIVVSAVILAAVGGAGLWWASRKP